MALQTCFGCRRTVPEGATRCPQCGRLLSEQRWKDERRGIFNRRKLDQGHDPERRNGQDRRENDRRKFAY